MKVQSRMNDSCFFLYEYVYGNVENELREEFFCALASNVQNLI